MNKQSININNISKPNNF